MLTINLFMPSYLNCVRIASGIILSPEQVMSGGFWPFLFGFQIDVIVGIVVAFVVVNAFQRFGTDYYIFKGVIVGLASWVLFYVTLSKFLSSVHPTGSILQAELSFLKHIVFGVSLTWSAVWFSKRLEENHGDT
ncbi:MAG TPA: hypothetical protein VNT57_03950 [Desulfobacteria bacterium]|nr:hypothetical protein [Desulfobacteria bacterium]